MRANIVWTEGVSLNPGKDRYKSEVHRRRSVAVGSDSPVLTC